MEKFVVQFLSYIIATGIGATVTGWVASMAFKKFIDDRFDSKIKEPAFQKIVDDRIDAIVNEATTDLKEEMALIWTKHDKMKEDFKKDFVLKELHDQSVRFLEQRMTEGFANINCTLVRIEQKVDRK